MANVRSDTMAIQLAVPSSRQSARLSHGRVRFRRAVMTVTAEANGTFYVLERFRASDTIIRILTTQTALAGFTAANLGWYVAGDWTVADQTAKAASVYASGLSLAAAIVTPTDIMTLSSGANWARQVWQDAGDSAEPTPGTQYDLVVTGTTVGGASGTKVFGIFYTTGD